MGLQKLANLDLRSLTVEQSKLYNKIVPDIQEIFNRIIGNIYEKNNNNYNWYFSSVASRNPHQSPLFERLCKIHLIERILSKNDYLEVHVDDYYLYRFILKNLKKDSLKIFFVGKYKGRIYILNSMLFRYAKYVTILLCKWIISSFTKVSLVRGKELFLIDTFVYSGNNGPGTIKNGSYNDRYFPNLLKYLTKKINYDVFYLPTILIGNGFILGYIKLLKQKNFLLKESFLKTIDWFKLFILPFRRINLEGIDLTFSSYNIKDLIENELLFNKFSISKLISYINYNFIKGLKNRNISINGFIEWYENQVIDRGMILGLRKCFPDVKVCGYQGFVICPIFNFYLAPTKYEHNNLLAPHLIAVTGHCLLNNPKKHYNIKTIVAPAFRFQHLYQNRINYPDREKLTIFMPFSICLKTSLNNLELLTKAVRSSTRRTETRIIVKMHPAFSTDEVKYKIERIDPKIEISLQDFNLVVQKAHILVGSTTSACVEALVYNLKILIVANNSGITSNPIPAKYHDQCKIVYDVDDLSKCISEAHKNKSENPIEQTKILEDCFQEVNHDSVRDFLTELNY